MCTDRYVLSLFSSAGIGELGIRASGLKILLSNELLKNRCLLYEENFPETKSLCGDVWELKDKICQLWTDFEVGNPYLIYATPPCQGMSFNSVGKRLQEIKLGRKPKDDPRNRLIIPTMDIVTRLKPMWLLLENVQEIGEMKAFLQKQADTLLEYDEQLVRRLIEKVTVHADRLTVKFKSGLETDVEL